MSTDSRSLPLPTLDKLGVPRNKINADSSQDVIASWFESFKAAVSSSDVASFEKLFIQDSYWRDLLSFTWDFRTLVGFDEIQHLVEDRLFGTTSGLTNLKLKDLDKPWTGFQQLYDDLLWIQASFTFDTKVGWGTGIFRLVPCKSESANDAISWKAHCVFTTLEDLRDYPEHSGSLRNFDPDHGLWESRRSREVEFADGDPTVLIIGGGQSGLDVAARLKYRGVSCLIVDKNDRLGDNWRKRYDALCLHDPVWYDHMPYIPFPPTWPVFTPARKLANWLESYADSMELNVWTSSEVSNVSQDESTKLWKVVVKPASTSKRKERMFTVKHVVFATGIGGGLGNIPKYPGMDDFKGQIYHSTKHRSAKDLKGKKVLVVGACTSAFDIAVEMSNHGVDVTMFQRSSTYVVSTTKGVLGAILGPFYSENGPPTDVADLLNASFPLLLSEKMAQRQVPYLEELDKDLLDGLRRVGFKLNKGYKDAGFFLSAMEKAGGYYLDVGGSSLIVSGAIKLKNDSQISRFTPTGIEFENGSKMDCDVVIFSTGYTTAHDLLKTVLDPSITEKLGKIWGLNEEGELNGIYRDDMGNGVSLKGLWYMMGNLALCRFYSKHVALQIKAMEEGIFGEKFV